MTIVRYRPKNTAWWQVLGDAGFWLMPIISMTGALLLSLIYIPGLPTLIIHWPALVMIYWACYRPQWQPTGLVFAFALLCDLLSGTPLIGITALIAVFITTVLRSQNNLFLALPFWMDWVIVSVCIFVWRGFEALAQGLLLGTWPGATMWFTSAFVSALAFPLVAIVLSPLRRAAFRF
jgi:rod shape-determining protein MreD